VRYSSHRQPLQGKAGNFFDVGVAQSSLLGEAWPVDNGIARFFKNLFGVVEFRPFCEGQEILLGRGRRSVDGGDMDALSAWAGAWSDVVGGGLAPLAGGIHEEAEIFGMVIPVSRENVEGGAPCQFAEFSAVTRDPQERVGDDFVGKTHSLMVNLSQAGNGASSEMPAGSSPAALT